MAQEDILPIRSEELRLTTVYEELRKKLLDLTLRNPMLNYRPLTRSKKQLQIVDDVLENVFRRLTSEATKLELIPLPEPDEIPLDERTAEFKSEFAYLKAKDLEYLAKLKGLAALGRDDEFETAKVDRWLRDRVREKLGLPSRPTRKQFDLANHAREHGIDPSIELAPTGAKNGTRTRKLQTLLLPDNLEARLESIQDLARLSKQEMGLSTLFIAFGFLEWYQADDSEKACFAPLLLLPVNLDEKIVGGRKCFSVSASTEAPEINISLAQYLEEKHGRVLPPFDDDEQVAFTIEAYFESVRNAVSGLKRWNVRRFLTLGHFAFGRLAMFQDLEASLWPAHPISHELVGSVLRGVELKESEADSSALLPPEDYAIDEPTAEKLAPFLMHDADASQHSAIIDVMKGENLVIEGPPGTGKSQTITNIIANALGSDKNASILFLSEKLAALEVVKRRLDKAGIGEFCLELHSEKSSPKRVVESLTERLAAGPRPTEFSRTLNRQSWDEARQELGSYLTALHNKDEDGATPFELFWRSILLQRSHQDVPELVLAIPISEQLLENPEKQKYLVNELQVFGRVAQNFCDQFGALSNSPWSAVGAQAKLAEGADLLRACERVSTTADRLQEIMHSYESIGVHAISQLRDLIVSIAHVPAPPNLEKIACFLGSDTARVRISLALLERVFTLDEELAADALASSTTPELLKSARGLFARLSGSSLSNQTPAQVFEIAKAELSSTKVLLSQLDETSRILLALGLNETSAIQAIWPACMAAIAASALPQQSRNWLAWRPQGTAERFSSLMTRWKGLTEADRNWASRLPAYDSERRPTSQSISEAAEILKHASSKYLPWKQDAWNRAWSLVESLGAKGPAHEVSTLLYEFSHHLAALQQFNADKQAGAVVGARWAGLATDFPSMEFAVSARETITRKLASVPHGTKVAEILTTLDSEALTRLGSFAKIAKANHKLFHAEELQSSKISIADARAELIARQRNAQSILDCFEVPRLHEIAVPLPSLVRYADLKATRDKLYREFWCSAEANAMPALHSKEDIHALREIACWIEQVSNASLPKAVADEFLSPSGKDAWNQFKADAVSASTAIDGFDSARLRLETKYKIALDLEPSMVVRKINDLLLHKAHLGEFLEVTEMRRQLEEAGIAEFLNAADAAQIRPDRLSEVLDFVLLLRRAERAGEHNPVLLSMTGNRLNTKRELFAAQDRLKMDSDRAEVRARLLGRRGTPGTAIGPKKNWTELALISNELKKTQRFLNLRALLRQAPDSIRALKPCFMMSPLSIAKFLPKSMIFDLVIIDEASQMRPEDALGALLRARQIVVVGDPKQLPPSDFFNRSLELGDVASEDDDDAINDEIYLGSLR